MVLKEEDLVKIFNLVSKYKKEYWAAEDLNLISWFNQVTKTINYKDTLMLRNYEVLMSRYKAALKEGSEKHLNIVTVRSDKPLKPGELPGVYDLKFTPDEVKELVKVEQDKESNRRRSNIITRVSLLVTLKLLIKEQSLWYKLIHPIYYPKEKQLAKDTLESVLSLRGSITDKQLRSIIINWNKLKDIKEINIEGEVFYKG